MGNSVKNDKEIQLDLGLVGSLSKVGLLGPLRSGPYSGPLYILKRPSHIFKSLNVPGKSLPKFYERLCASSPSVFQEIQGSLWQEIAVSP